MIPDFASLIWATLAIGRKTSGRERRKRNSRPCRSFDRLLDPELHQRSVSGQYAATRPRDARRKLSRSRVVVPWGSNRHEVDMRARSQEKRSEKKKGKLEKPANHYKSPDDIVKDEDLSPAEKGRRSTPGNRTQGRC